MCFCSLALLLCLFVWFHLSWVLNFRHWLGKSSPRCHPNAPFWAFICSWFQRCFVMWSSSSFWSAKVKTWELCQLFSGYFGSICLNTRTITQQNTSLLSSVSLDSQSTVVSAFCFSCIRLVSYSPHMYKRHLGDAWAYFKSLLWLFGPDWQSLAGMLHLDYASVRMMIGRRCKRGYGTLSCHLMMIDILMWSLSAKCLALSQLLLKKV